MGGIGWGGGGGCCCAARCAISKPNLICCRWSADGTVSIDAGAVNFWAVSINVFSALTF